MNVQLVGKQPINFTTDGKTVSGTNLFCAFQDNNVEGLRTERFFVSNDISIPDVKLNSTISIEFNFKGKILKIEKV